jgi:alkanesulfonate monooxygenase SsuD/methylene tetrahydromethanopterin reductase-like flavin-dependent oxidoreductase (luciferase family)
MVGANQPRMLAIALPHVDAWNTWFSRYGNTVDGFAAHNAEVSRAAELAGRDPAEIERSACVFVRTGDGPGERTNDDGVAPVELDALRAHLDGLAEAGADEAILVLDPVTEASVRRLPV